MTRIIVLGILIFTAVKLQAQQCGFEHYYLFVVNPHFQGNNPKIPAFKMYLADENDQPVRVAATYQDGNQWLTKSDTLFFWKNDTVQQRSNVQLRRKYYHIGKYYVVAFRLDAHSLKDPLQYPVYKLKIEGGYNALAMENYPARSFHLPLQKALRICGNGLLNDGAYQQPVKALDGSAFQPLDIVVDQEEQQEAAAVEAPVLQYAVRLMYSDAAADSESTPSYLVTGARIYDTRTGKLNQEIYIPGKTASVSRERKSIIEFADFYNRGIAAAQDFSVVTESWRDLQHMVNRKRTHFYIFNTASKRYELDTALSNYDDVFYYKPLKKMRRYDYITTPKSKIQLTWQLENKRWELADRTETLSGPVVPPVKYAPKACVLFKDKSHTLPVQAVTGPGAARQITDTFWLYNACDEAVLITSVQSASRDFFSIHHSLPPRQYTPLVFKGILHSTGSDFNTNYYYCNLTLADNTILSFGITVPVVSNNMVVVYNKDSTVNHAVARQENKRYTTAVLTHPDGSMRARGLVLDGDTMKKAGTWRYFMDGTWRTDQEVYSKAVYLSAFNEQHSGQHAGFKIKVLENGSWKHPVKDSGNREQLFFVTPDTDSIVAYTDSTAFGFRLQYEQLPEQIQKQVFLLKPGERSLKVGYYTMPFNTISDSYSLLLNYHFFSNRNSTTEVLTDSVINALKARYPKLAKIYVSRTQRGIGLAALNESEKRQLLAELEKDSTVAFVCQLFTLSNQQQQFYCNNMVYAELTAGKLGEIKKTALELGFTDVREDMGSNRFWLNYKGKIIDEAFFEAFRKLTESNFVLNAFFNMYAEAEPDSGFIKQ